ncbi:hypothetical protein GmHk_09G026187 [Glycine max]|nr:hypothetical protein GmHk_09G026187 [Glycine max]
MADRFEHGERVNNLVWALERFRGLFLRNDRLPVVIDTDRDLALMNAVKVVFPECTNLLCKFHIDKNVKTKCKSLIGQKNDWDYVMDSWGNLVDCPSEQEFPEHLQRVESAHWSLKMILQNSVEDLCSVWDAMNNMMMLQHTEIRASFETSTHVVGHVFKKIIYKRLLGMVSRYALNEISVKFERNHARSSLCMRATKVRWWHHPTGCSPYGLCEAEVSIKEEIDRIHKRFKELDVCGKVTFKSKL